MAIGPARPVMPLRAAPAPPQVIENRIALLIDVHEQERGEAHVTALNDKITTLWQTYAALAMLASGLLGLLLLIGFAIWAKRSGKPLRPVALSISMNLALLLNAEGMWVIATERLNLPKVFAVLVFAVFEICFLTATSLAAEQYRNTTIYGPDGKIETPGHPGPMLWIAALIAAVSGIIVASNAVTGTEKLLRLAVPCVIFLMWWAALTAAGQRVRRGRFAYSPRRLAERWGWLIPDDDPDLVRMASERQARRMVVNYHRVASSRWPESWWRNRLLKDARTAGEPVVEEVIEQLARIQRVMDLLIPDEARPAVPTSMVPASHSPGLAEAEADHTGNHVTAWPATTDLDPRATTPVLPAMAKSAGVTPMRSSSPDPADTCGGDTVRSDDLRFDGIDSVPSDRRRPDATVAAGAAAVAGTAAVAGSATLAALSSDTAAGRAVYDRIRPNGANGRAAAVTSRVPAVSPPASAAATPTSDPALVSLDQHRARLAADFASGDLENRPEQWKRDDARNLYQAALAVGTRISGAELGRIYGKDAKWGQRRIADVRPAEAQQLASAPPAD